MNLKQTLTGSRGILAAANIEDAPLESELLLRHALKLSRVQLFLDLDRELSPEEDKVFRHLVKRRLRGEPTAYLTGHREFFGLGFRVDPRVLIPRPESELLVEKAINLVKNHAIATIAEIGTGCGAIAISLALNLPGIRIFATDISAPALEVARLNCEQHGVANDVCLLQGDMLAPLPEPVDLIVANLPYVKESDLAGMNSANFEPSLALDGGTDGLEKIYRLCQGISGKLRSPGYLLLEIGQGQSETVAAVLQNLFPPAQIEITPDFSGIERVVSLGPGVSAEHLVYN